MQDQIKELLTTKYGPEGVERARSLGLIGSRKKVSEPEDAKELLKENERMIVDEEDVENALNHGWEFVSALPSGRMLVEREV